MKNLFSTLSKRAQFDITYLPAIGIASQKYQALRQPNASNAIESILQGFWVGPL
jgi:hypothetical protein